MIRTIRTLTLTALFSLLALSSSLFAQNDSDVLLDFGREQVLRADFERVYAKNNGGPEEAAQHSRSQLREYLDLYINFKRKVFQAEDLGMDTTAAFKSEFATYQKQLAQPYLSAKDVEEALIKEAYERSKTAVRASHILINVAEGASPDDTLKAWTLIQSLRDSAVSGNVPFADLASRHSQDPSAAKNGGDLGYFSVFDMVYPFESAAYNNPVGSVSEPLRTRFGYHIIEVKDKVSFAGKKRAAHIIIRIGDRYGAKDDAQAQKMIDELYQKASSGEEFSQLAADYSDDPGSAKKGGDLGYGRLLPEMEQLKMILDLGEVSKPFKTQFGWHVMKVTEIDSIGNFEKEQGRIRQKINRDSRAQLGRKAMVNRIKTDNDFAINEKNWSDFKAGLDDKFALGLWQPDSTVDALLPLELFRLGDKESFDIGGFVNYYKQQRPRQQGQSADAAAGNVLSSYLETTLLQYEEDHLAENNPDYRNLLREYRDGILLFSLMEQKVWNKAMEDTAGLRAYYDEHPDLFYATAMTRVNEYRSTNHGTLEEVEYLLNRFKSDEEIAAAINKNSSLQVRITEQVYEIGEGGLPRAFFNRPAGFMSSIFGDEGFYRIILVKEQLAGGTKPYESARAETITYYQEYLEQAWLDELEALYPVKINEDAFDSLYQ